MQQEQQKTKIMKMTPPRTFNLKYLYFKNRLALSLAKFMFMSWLNKCELVITSQLVVEGKVIASSYS
jgi:hypothetical protein